MFSINLNDFVRVKLTDYGKDIYYKHWTDIMGNIKRVYPTNIYDGVALVEDGEGFCKFQLHDFMNIYGEYMFPGIGERVLEDLNLYFEDDVKLTVTFFAEKEDC